MDINTKIAIITGASKGIGKAISRGLAKMNYQTILIGRNKTDLEKVATQMIDEGDITPHVFQSDITNADKIKDIIQQVKREFGRIDVLVNNAGVFIAGSTDISQTDFVKMLETNLTAQFVFLNEVVPVMKEQGSGYIFNVASRAGKIGFAGNGGYSASKFGLVGLSESLYREINPLGIRVTALCPGWVNTNMAYEAGVPISGEQMIQAEDIFKTIKWLLSLSPGACVKEVVIETPYNIY